MNSQGFAADMVCLLEEATRPRDVALFKQMMESFFTVGASRIELIGKVMDLDNEIGGYNFDIPLLENTEEAITNVGQAGGKRRYILTILHRHVFFVKFYQTLSDVGDNAKNKLQD